MFRLFGSRFIDDTYIHLCTFQNRSDIFKSVLSFRENFDFFMVVSGDYAWFFVKEDFDCFALL